MMPIPLLQLQLTPEVVELPVSVAGLAVQVSCMGFAEAFIFGCVVSAATKAVSVPLQPVDGLNTVNV